MLGLNEPMNLKFYQTIPTFTTTVFGQGKGEEVLSGKKSKIPLILLHIKIMTEKSYFDYAVQGT